MSAPIGNPVHAEPSFIVFSDDWGEHPSSCQHLFRMIGRSHRVLWVNTVGMRRPALTRSDLRKIRSKVARMVRSGSAESRPPARNSAGSEAGLDVHVSQPLMLPFSSIRLVRELNRRSVAMSLAKASAGLGLMRPVVVSTVPNACDFVGGLGARRIVYYCVDDFAQWPGLEHELVREMEAELVGQADLLIATSQQLLRRLAASGKPTVLLSHGVDLQLFAREAPYAHPLLEDVPRPRAGYFGLFDERSDLDLIDALAARMPDYSLVFTGPIAVDTGRLRSRSNVRFTGPVPLAELPALVKGLDALILPYAVNELTATISPLKLKEYLATGKPIVAAPLAEVLPFRQYLTLASTLDEWEEALRAAPSVDVVSRRRLMADALADESWSRKASQFLEMCSVGGRGG